MWQFNKCKRQYFNCGRQLDYLINTTSRKRLFFLVKNTIFKSLLGYIKCTQDKYLQAKKKKTNETKYGIHMKGGIHGNKTMVRSPI